MLELLREADMILNACGRAVPPPGYRFVDLPRVIPFWQDLAVPPETSFQARIANTSDTIFVCRGVAIDTSCFVRLRWPDGKFLNQLPSTGNGSNSFPMGQASSMLALDQERILQPDSRISVEFSGTTSGTCPISLWGVLRYLLKDTGDAPAKNAACLIGYPARAGRGVPGVDPKLIPTMVDPLEALAIMARLKCGANQNIMAPEFRLGNQCVLETPAGFEDESFTFYSNPITVPANGQSYNNVIIVPGSDDVVIKKLSAFVTYTGGLGSTIPTVALRLPNGYSVTGGDMIPMNLGPGGFPIFPTLRVGAGGRLIVDMADMQASGGSGASVTVLEFDGVKRRRAVTQ